MNENFNNLSIEVTEGQKSKFVKTSEPVLKSRVVHMAKQKKKSSYYNTLAIPDS